MKTLKNKILMVLVMLLTLSMVGLGVFSFNSKNANADTIFAVTNGAEIRLDGNNGMRFVTEVSKSKIKTLKETYEGAKIEYGTFVMPADFLEAGSENYKGEATIGAFFGEGAIFCWGKKVEGKQQVIHIPALLSVQEEGDVDLIKGSVVGIKDANLAREYTGIAYIKVTPVDGEPIYELATAQEESISMINLATDSLDNDKIVSDNGYKASVEAYIAQYKAYAQIETVNYTVNYNYNGKVVTETKSVTFGLKTEASNVPADSEGVDSRYFYFNGELANKTARADGSTVITVDFTAKDVLTKSVILGKNTLSESDKTVKVVATEFNVDVNGKNVVVSASELDLTKDCGDKHSVVEFGETEVYDITLELYTALISTKDDFKHLYFLADEDSYGGYQHSNGKWVYTNYAGGDSFYLTNNIDMNNESLSYKLGVGNDGWYGASSGYSDWGFRGTIRGNGYTLYNVKKVLPLTSNSAYIDSLGVVANDIAGNLFGAIVEGNFVNCYIDATFTPSGDGVGFIGSGAYKGSAKFTNCVIKVNKTTDYNSNSLLVDASKVIFTDSYVISNASAYTTAPSETAPIVKGLKDALTSGEMADFVKGGSVWDESSVGTPSFDSYKVEDYEGYYGKYILNEDKNGRVENPEGLTFGDFVLTQAELQGATHGTVYSKIDATVSKTIRANIKVASALIYNKEQLTNIFRLTTKGTDTSSGNTSLGYTYIMNDIDMTGVTSITSTRNPGANDSYGGWGTEGVLDGQGYTIYNSPALFSLQHQSGTIKNLGWVSANRLVDTQIAGLIDNCYIDILVNSTSDTTSALTNRITKNANIKNTIVKVTNVGANKSNVVYAISDAGATFVNSYFLTNSNYYYTAGSQLPVMVGLDGLTVAQVNSFKEGANLSVWDISNDVKFKSAIIDEKNDVWGKYVYNEDYSGRVANSTSLSYKGIELDNVTLTAASEGSTIVETAFVNGEYVRYLVKVGRGVLNNAKEFATLYLLSGDGKVAGSGTSWGGYYILNADVDVLLYPQVLNGRASSVSNYPGWGFEGTIDGNGHTVYNVTSRMFEQLGNWGSTIKNISFLNITDNFALNLGGANFENCYFEFNYKGDKTYIFGQTVGVQASGALSTNFRNSVIVFNNLTNLEVNLINGVDKNDTYTSTINYYNTILVTNSCNYAGIEIANKPTVIALDGKYEGDLSGFNTSFWDISGNYPVAKNGSSAIYEKGFAWGGYKLNADASARVENTDGLTGEINGKSFTVPYAYLSKIKGYTDKSYYVTIDVGEEKYYTVKVYIATSAINTAKDWEKFELLACGSTGNHSFGGIVALNADIDIAGVSPIMGSSSFSTNYGFRGTLEGNGRTLSNATTFFFRFLSGNNENTQGVIRNLNVINLSYSSTNYMMYATGTALIENCYLQITRTGGGQSPGFINQVRGYGTVIRNTTIEYKSVGGGTAYLVGSFNAYGPATDSVTFDNVRVITDNGYFKVGGGVTTEWDELEAGGTANRHARDFVIGAETPYVVNKPAA